MNYKLSENCQIFTPKKNALFLLDKIGYKKNLYNKKVIENSCGDGNILSEIVRRYIEDCEYQGYSKEKTKKGLEKDIYGIEIDKFYQLACKERLEKVAAENQIYDVSWNIINDNALEFNFDFKFDYVIGNPPYIMYRKLPIELREKLRDNFFSCKEGQFDYCYAFVEYGFNCLSDGGKLAYIIPSSIFKNRFSHNLRELIKPFVTEIYDYYGERQFNNALTASAILIIDKSGSHAIKYTNEQRKKIINIDKSKLGDKWIFSNRKLNSGKIRFGDKYKVANTIATLKNNVFILKNCVDLNNGYIKSGHLFLEKGALLNAMAPRMKSLQGGEMIIFPYYYSDKKIVRYEEKEYEEKFPNTFQYLSALRNDLENRTSDSQAKWYEYGRSQAIQDTFKEMLLISTVFSDSVKVYEIDENSIPYSGIYIISLDPKRYSLERAKEILSSDVFLRYLKLLGTNTGAGNSSLRITVKDIMNFMID